MARVWVLNGWWAFGFIIFSVASFPGIIVFLQETAPHYDASVQTLSELALERCGSLLVAAFSLLSLGLFLLAWQWRATPLSLMGKGLVLAGIFLGVSAGVPLTVSVGIHVFSVMLAFVFWMLSIYGILRHPSVAYPFRFFSGVIFALVLLLGGMGPQWIALGLVERLVLALLLAWQVTVSFFTRVKPFSVLD